MLHRLVLTFRVIPPFTNSDEWVKGEVLYSALDSAESTFVTSFRDDMRRSTRRLGMCKAEAIGLCVTARILIAASRADYLRDGEWPVYTILRWHQHLSFRLKCS
jgi:hypothetical protein